MRLAAAAEVIRGAGGDAGMEILPVPAGFCEIDYITIAFLYSCRYICFILSPDVHAAAAAAAAQAPLADKQASMHLHGTALLSVGLRWCKLETSERATTRLPTLVLRGKRLGICAHTHTHNSVTTPLFA
jgi:hypothetical protein